MIAFLEGELAFKTPMSAYINVGGVGYEVAMSLSDLSKMGEVGSFVRVLTYMQVREDAVALYGFLSAQDKDTFMKLLNVSGVGPKVALGVLSVYSAQQLAQIIQAQDVGLMSKVPGIGKKTASRIILELKGSFDDIAALTEGVSGAGAAVAPTEKSDAAEALLSMGFTGAEVELALKGSPEDASVSELLQYALKKLG